MARVEKLVEREPLRVSIHGEVEATFHIFKAQGETFLQIDSYGAPDRQIPSKVSQSIQLGDAGRKKLLQLLLELQDQ